MKRNKNFFIVKKSFKSLLSFVIVLTLVSTQSVSFAKTNDNVGNAEKDSDVKVSTEKMMPIRPVIKMSLEEAIEKMTTTGIMAETAELNKRLDKAEAEGYDEKYDKIRKTLRRIDDLQAIPPAMLAALQLPSNIAMIKASQAQSAGVTLNNKAIVKLLRDFKNENIENNYEADMNKIKLLTTELYEGVLLAEKYTEMAEENLKTKKETLKNVNLRYEVGMDSKISVLQAKQALEEAKQSVEAAKNKAKELKMKFNLLLGNNVMQKIEFTDKLMKKKGDVTPVSQAIMRAIDNNMKIKGVDLKLKIKKLEFNEFKMYPKSSSKYLTAKHGIAEAEQNVKNIRSSIEMDVRNKKNILDEKTKSLDTALEMRESTLEIARLMKLMYAEGMINTDKILLVEMSVYKANTDYAKALSEYNKAFREYEDVQGVGTERI